jgi:S1-C subfamily serine protease
MWKQLSDELTAATASAGRRLLYVGSDNIAGRTAVAWGEGLALTLARQANDGESVPVILPGGTEAAATVHAWDSRTGLAVLKVPGLADPRWTVAAVPAAGSLVLTVAFPSPQGVESRLDLVRFAGGATAWGRGVTIDGHFQTDASPFPGFTGAAVVNAEGALVGFVAENRSGNSGFIVSAEGLARLVTPMVASGSPKQAWLGVSTRPGGGQGLVLLAVEDGSPAQRAGWKAGDLLLSLADQGLKDPSDLVRVVAGLAPDAQVSARLLRDGEVHVWPVTPTSRR